MLASSRPIPIIRPLMSVKRPQLNPQQRKAVQHDSGPLLVLAGAGTGKTHTVTARIIRLLRNGAAPESILAVTFTNKAAAEMKERLRKRVGKKHDLSAMIVSTFHSLCVRILRHHSKLIGFPGGFTIADTAEQVGIIRKAMRNLGGYVRLRPDEVLQRISRCKSAGVSQSACSRKAIDEDEMTVAALYGRYEEGLRRIQALDFDDLLIRALELLEQNGRVRAKWQKRFQHVLVDEFQDTSRIQCRLVELLAGRSRSLCVVGDDDQSIYSWRGAVPGNILRFGEIFPGAEVVRLEENYRSTGTILNAANALIANNEKRHPKNLWSRLGEGGKISVRAAEDQDDEAERIVAEIEREVKRNQASPSDFAVILRTNVQTRPLEQELRAARIPYVVIGGTSFFDRKEARDMLSYLTVIANPRADAAMLRVINTPARGIGDRTLEALTKFAHANNMPLTRALDSAAEIPGISNQARQACVDFAAQLSAWRGRAKGRSLEKLVDIIVDESHYEEEVFRLYDDPLEQAARVNIAREVGDGLRAYLSRDRDSGQAGLLGFLQEAMLWGREDQTAREEQASARALKLITVHSAKGLEFDRVYIAGFEEELMPHKNSVEAGDISEERRLCYVAVTRARRELTLFYCKSRIIRGKRVPRKPSRFLDEIPGELLDRRDRILSGREAKSFATAMLEKLRAREA